MYVQDRNGLSLVHSISVQMHFFVFYKLDSTVLFSVITLAYKYINYFMK